MIDVAKAAGVTQATVSYVLNDRGEISEPVIRRVLDAADQIGYIPNIVARNFKMSKSNIIGIIVPDVMNSYFNEVIKYTETITREQGFFSFVCNAMHDPKLEDWYVTSLVQNKVAGVIIGYGLTNRECIQKLKRHNVPFVVLDDDLDENATETPCILMNNIKGSFLAVQHFVSLGISDIAYITEPIYNLALKRRLEGFMQAIDQFGLLDPQIHIAESKGEYDIITQGYTGAGEVLSRGKPGGIFVSTDHMALGVLKKLHELGIRIPKDIAVIGYDDVALSSVVRPSLTTISQPVMTMCIQGTKILLGMINGSKDPVRKMILEPSIVIRESAPSKPLHIANSLPSARASQPAAGTFIRT
jgi:DNA-binding LacI/PurR family transcriptional regulator